MKLNLEELDLNRLIVDAVGRLQPTAPYHPITLSLDHALSPLVGDRDKLKQVVSNLFNNAVKYSPNGGEITISSHLEDDVAHVRVQDRGIGIPPDALEKVFERFGRVESGASRQIHGTGLGLPISRQIIHMHNGTMWAESTLGEGSTFHFTVPLAGPPSSS